MEDHAQKAKRLEDKNPSEDRPEQSPPVAVDFLDEYNEIIGDYVTVI